MTPPLSHDASSRVLPLQIIDGLTEFVEAERLLEDLGYEKALELGFTLGRGVARDEHDREARIFGMQPLNQLRSPAVGHPNVGDDQVGGIVDEAIERVYPTLGLRHPAFFPHEISGYELGGERFIFHDEHVNAALG